MARPKGGIRLTKDDIRFIVKNYEKLSMTDMATRLEVNHTTIIHWVRKLRKAGFTLLRKPQVNESDKIIEELKKEFNI